jgi:hypothetical protein
LLLEIANKVTKLEENSKTHLFKELEVKNAHVEEVMIICKERL